MGSRVSSHPQRDKRAREGRESVHRPTASIPTYLCLEKSCRGSRGPSGTFALPRPAALWLIGGSGRPAVIALEALVLRSRLPWSPVFWNLRTRSSARGAISITVASMRPAPKCFFVPEEPLESSETVDPDRSGTFVDVMARIDVRGSVDMVSTHSVRRQHQQCRLCCTRLASPVCFCFSLLQER